MDEKQVQEVVPEAEKPKKLTPREARFKDEYLVDLNATKAAIRAGYSERSARQIGSENLSKPYIKVEIDKAIAERNARTALNQDWIIAQLQDTLERCKQEVPVLDTKGQPTGEYRFDSAGANKAAELLGKHKGMWQDKLKVEGDLSHEARIKHLYEQLVNGGQ